MRQQWGLQSGDNFTFAQLLIGSFSISLLVMNQDLSNFLRTRASVHCSIQSENVIMCRVQTVLFVSGETKNLKLQSAIKYMTRPK